MESVSRLHLTTENIFFNRRFLFYVKVMQKNLIWNFLSLISLLCTVPLEGGGVGGIKTGAFSCLVVSFIFLHACKLLIK